MAYEAVRLITEKALPIKQLISALAQFSNRVDTYIAIDSFAAFRAIHDSDMLLALNEQPLSWIQLQTLKLKNQKPVLNYSQKKFHHIGTENDTQSAQEHLLRNTLAELEQGTIKPLFNVSFAGTTADIRIHRSINRFIELARKQGAKVNVGVMSQTGMALCGKGALSVSVIRV